jgi:pyruvate kinase
MVARGDLGVEMPPQKVPLIQNKLIQLSNQDNKPVIVATQMLESMIDHSRPTRAEVTDVAGACLAGADAVMLSAETASGKYPYETLSMMDTILRETEAYQFFTMGGRFKKADEDVKGHVQEALGLATAQISRDLMVRCIFVPTHSGYSARFISANRPAAPIIALASSEAVRRKLNLQWGVYPYLATRDLNVTESLKMGEKIIRDELKLASKGDYIIMLSSMGPQHLGTNSVVVHQIS